MVHGWEKKEGVTQHGQTKRRRGALPGSIPFPQGRSFRAKNMVVVGRQLLHFAYGGLVVEIQPLNC